MRLLPWQHGAPAHRRTHLPVSCWQAYAARRLEGRATPLQGPYTQAEHADALAELARRERVGAQPFQVWAEASGRICCMH